jgi:hypothetical protein
MTKQNGKVLLKKLIAQVEIHLNEFSALITACTSFSTIINLQSDQTERKLT